jgi:hypothetical protein
MRTARLVGVAALVWLSGCAEKNGDAIARLKPEFAPMRARLAKVGQTIGALPPNAAPAKLTLSPPPVYDAGKKEFNSDIFAFEQLADVDAKPGFDLILGNELERALRYTGEHSPAASSMLAERHGKQMEQWMRATLGYRYLVVYRTVGLVEPRVVDEHTFTPGEVAVALYLVDLGGGDAVSPLGVVLGRTATSTSYALKKGDDPKERLAAFAHSTMYESLRTSVHDKLVAATGGRVVFD